MLLRSLCWWAATRPRHTWMALMVDECGGMPLSSIAPFVQVTFAPAAHPGMAEKTINVNAACTPSASPSAAPPSVSPPPPGRAPEERAHAWAAVARLLCEGGDWARAAAVLDGLPQPLRQRARLKAIRGEWPLPRTITEAWQQGARTEKEVADTRLAESPPVTATVLAGRRTDRQRTTKTTTATHPASASTAGPPTTHKLNYTLYRSDELVRMAYSLRKSPLPTPATPLATSAPLTANAAAAAAAAAAQALQKEQLEIVRELRRRGAIAEVLQCVVNWQRRQLLRPDVEVMQGNKAAGRRTGEVAAAALLFDGVGAVKALLFPAAAATAGAGVTRMDGINTAFASGGGVGEPLRYSAAQLVHISEAAATHPTLVARCLRDRAVGERLLQYAGEAKSADLAFMFLQAIAAADGPLQSTSAPPRAALAVPHAASASSAAASLVEAYWRALATLLPLLYSHWRTQSKATKEKLVRALQDALDATRRAHADGAGSTPSLSTVSASPLSFVHAAVPPNAGVSERCSRAIKACVESACSPLLHHEPQVRFLRLRVFGLLAQAMTSLHVAVPNALVQCLFLCMADTTAVASTATATPFAAEPTRSTKAAPCTPLDEFLSAAPSERWQPALAMLHAAHKCHDYRVTAAHERALLSGLQSISITKTWAAALRAVSECEKAFGVTPDARTLPTLLLNLKQQSWQEAFRVLRWVPGGDPAAASPMILRDLQLVALKHASWEVPLRLMTALQERRADGFMNYLYCLCAASRGGRAEEAFAYFRALRLGRGRHTTWQAVSPFNELTVAVVAVAMLDHGHSEALHTFAQCVLSMPPLTAAVKGTEGEGTALGLTPDGRWMTQAADVAALLACKREDQLAALLLSLSVDAVQPVLRRLVALRCLAGMGDLHAPIRLVFDVLGHGSSPQQQRVHRGFLTSVESTQASEGTFETRQRGTVDRRKHLFIPMAHQRQQRREVAVQLGGFVKSKEAVMPAEVVRLIAETMVEEGVGAEYMTAALL